MEILTGARYLTNLIYVVMPKSDDVGLDFLNEMKNSDGFMILPRCFFYFQSNYYFIDDR